MTALELIPTDEKKNSVEQILETQPTVNLLPSTAVDIESPDKVNKAVERDKRDENMVGEDVQEDQQTKDDQLLLDEIKANNQVIDEVSNIKQSEDEEEKLTDITTDLFEFGGGPASPELSELHPIVEHPQNGLNTGTFLFNQDESIPMTTDNVQNKTNPPGKNTKPDEIKEKINNTKINPNNIKPENVKPDKNLCAEKVTPLCLISVNLNQPSDPNVPKSVSQYFSEPNITEVNEEVEQDMPRLSMLSNTNGRSNFEEVLSGALGEVDKEIQRLDENAQNQLDSIDCDCICKNENLGLIPLIQVSIPYYNYFETILTKC